MQIWFLSNGSYSLKKCHNPFGKAIQPPPPLRQNSGWTWIFLTWGFPNKLTTLETMIHRPTEWLTGVKCRATTVAKKLTQVAHLYEPRLFWNCQKVVDSKTHRSTIDSQKMPMKKFHPCTTTFKLLHRPLNRFFCVLSSIFWKSCWERQSYCGWKKRCLIREEEKNETELVLIVEEEGRARGGGG